MEQPGNTITIFCCYAHKDLYLLNELKMHLSPLQRQNVVNMVDDGDINAGTEWRAEIRERLNDAKIILLLISVDFISSNYSYSIEMQYALERHERGETCVIPILLRPISNWEQVPFGNIELGDLQALPTGAEAVTTWIDHDLAWKNVAEGIYKVASDLLKNPSSKQSRMYKQALPGRESIVSPRAKTQSNRRKQRDLAKGGKLVLGVNWHIMLGIVLVGLLLLGGVIVRGKYPFSASKPQKISQTLTPSGTPLLPPIPDGWKLLIDNDNDWNDSSPDGCAIEKGIYHIFMTEQNYCLNNATLKSNLSLLNSYTYEIRESILQGQQSGIIFCKAPMSFYKSLQTPYTPYYYFSVTTDGKYALLYDDGNGNNGLITNNSIYINKNIKSFNMLAVTIYNKIIYMYVNGHFVDKYAETYKCNGSVIGVEATGYSEGKMEPTEVLYDKTRMWGP